MRRFLRRVIVGVRSLFRRSEIEQDLDDELMDYLERATEARTLAGVDKMTAARDARVEMGSLEGVKDQVRQSGWESQVDTLWRDIRYAMRMFVVSPGFTAVSILTLAVGIGAVSAVYTVADPLLFTRLPVKNPDELVTLTVVRPPARTFVSSVPSSFTLPDISIIEAQRLGEPGGLIVDAFLVASTATYRLAQDQTDDGVHRIEVKVAPVSRRYFATLDVIPALGRTFVDNESPSGALPVGVVSDSFWRHSLAQDPQVLGRVITLTRLDRRLSVTIIGVAPPGFSGTDVGRAVDVWMPLQPRSLTTTPRDFDWWTGGRMMARLRPGIGLEEARTELSAVYQRLLREWVDEFATHLTPTQRQAFLDQRLITESGARGWSPLRSDFTRPLTILMAAGGSVLLIACVNLVVLFTARGIARGRDFAVRLALGSGRVRLVRQHFTASIVLASLGGGLGLVLGWWGSRGLLQLVPPLNEAALDFSVTSRLVGLTVAVSLTSALLFGLIPALRLTSSKRSTSLRVGSVHPAGARSTLNRLLILSQVALSLVSLVIALLFARTLHNLRAVDAGFEKNHVVRVEIDGRVDYHPIVSRLEHVPGVESGTAWTVGLFADGVGMVGPVVVEGSAPEIGQDLTAMSTSVGPRFFETMGIQLVHGRPLRAEDVSSQPRGVVVSSAFAKHFFSTDSAVGRRFRLSRASDAMIFEIAGVAEDAKYRSLKEDPQWIVYSPLAAGPQRVNIALRTSGDIATIPVAIRDVLRQSNPAVPVGGIRTLSDITEGTIVRERFLAHVGTIIGALALFLACLGLYATTAYAVVQRTAEIGIRMALGADVRRIITMLMCEMGWTVGAGTMLGLVLVGMVTRVVASLLFGVGPTDPWTVASAMAMLVVAATGAAYLAARRSTRIQPVAAIKYE